MSQADAEIFLPNAATFMVLSIELARLNAIYEAKFPGLRFVTYVAGRSRAAVADEIASLLGDKTAALKDAIELSEADIRAQGTDEWQSELDRASDALWEIAVDRAGKLKLESESNNGSTAAKASNEDGEESKSEAVPSTASATEVPASTDSTAAVTKDGKASSDSIGQDVPFLSLPSFRMLVLSSPVLESFFKSDLTESFYLDPVERSQSGGAYAWHTAPSLPGAPRAVPGASKEPASEATYSRDVTTGARGKVVGFLGNLLGEEGKAKMNQLADQVGQRLQTHTVTGPRPSFGRNSTLDGGKMDTQELREKEAEERRRAAEERKSTLGNRLFNALRAPARTPSTQDLKSAAGSSSSTPLSPSDSQAERGRTLEKQPSFSSGTSKADKRISLRGSDLSTAGPKAAAEALRAAQEALLQERPAFVIDEVGEDEGEGEADDGAEGGAEVEDLGEVVEEAHSGQKAEGLLSGREAQMAKDLRSAPAQ